jgi:hypothetical protein
LKFSILNIIGFERAYWLSKINVNWFLLLRRGAGVSTYCPASQPIGSLLDSSVGQCFLVQKNADQIPS